MVSLISIVIAILLFLGGLVGYILKRLSVFEIKQWRKRKRKKKAWYDEVEQTANGIIEAWHYSGLRPREEAKERTAEEMEKYTERLKEHRTNQNATDEMTEKMNDIIELWDRSRSLVLQKNRSRMYRDRGERISTHAEELKDLLDWERKGWIRKFISSLPDRGRNSIDRVQHWWYERQDRTLPYEIYRAIHPDLTDDQISDFVEGDVFLRINREYATDAVYYDEEDTYNFFQIDFDSNGEITVIDKYPDRTLSDEMLLERLESAESVDTIQNDDIIPDGQNLEEFEHSDRT